MCIYIYMYALALKSTDSERDWFSHSDPAILFGGFNSQVIGDNHPFPGGPLSVVKVCASKLRVKIVYRYVGGPLSVVKGFTKI